MSASKKGSDRRRWERLPLAIPVFVRGLDPNGKQFVDFATALDISVGGALLAIHRHLPKGSKILLEIPSAPALQAATKVPRVAKQNFYARTVRVTTGENCHLLGLKFQRPMKHPAKRPARATTKSRAKGKTASSGV